MITGAHVRAQVVDIRDRTKAVPADLVSDANVLYWIFYPNFSGLAYAGGKQPLPYQVATYSAYWKRAATAGCQFHVASATIGEFARIAEYAELEAIWLTDSPPPQPDPARPVAQFDARVCKFARYHYGSLLPGVRNNVAAMVAGMRKSVLLLGQFATADDEQSHAIGAWEPSCGDFPDATLVVTAQEQGTLHVLSDDMDLATFAGITLYTANRNTITVARSAGRLL